MTHQRDAESIVREIRRRGRRKYSFVLHDTILDRVGFVKHFKCAAQLIFRQADAVMIILTKQRMTQPI